MREARSEMSADSKNEGNHSTLRQVTKAGEQMLQVTITFEPAFMAEASSRKRFKGALKQGDISHAEAAVDKKLDERKKQLTRKPPAPEVLRCER